MVGSGLDVWEVIATVRDNEGSVEEAAAYLRIPIELVQGAVAFYGQHRNEIDADIELNETEYSRRPPPATARGAAESSKDEPLPRVAELLGSRGRDGWQTLLRRGYRQRGDANMPPDDPRLMAIDVNPLRRRHPVPRATRR